MGKRVRSVTAGPRVVSLVPSWTETLIDCGVRVVGRSEFCVHPEPLVEGIPVAGTTKDLRLEVLRQLDAKLLLLDREENTLEMAERSPIPWHATHIRHLRDVAPALKDLGTLLANQALEEVATRWQQVACQEEWSGPISELPGVVEWLRRPQGEVERILYLIWARPWMAISHRTFIGSMLSLLGQAERLPRFELLYPEVDLRDYDPASTLLLASTEPFPFRRKRELLAELPHACALVDGELYGWFGLRSLRFLEEAFQISHRPVALP